MRELSEKPSGKGRPLDLLETVGSVLLEAPRGLVVRKPGRRGVEFLQDFAVTQARDVAHRRPLSYEIFTSHLLRYLSSKRNRSSETRFLPGRLNSA